MRFESLEGRRLLAVIDSMGLASDTGVSASDGITNDATLIGSASWTPQADETARIEFDHHADGSVDGSVSLSGSDQFQYDPVALDGAFANYDGLLRVGYRVVVERPGQSAEVGNWSSLDFHLDRVAPNVSSNIDGATVEPISQVDLHFDEPIDLNTVTSTNVFVRNAQHEVVDQNLVASDSQSLAIQFTDLLGSGDYSSHIANVVDLAGNPLSATDISWNVNSAPRLTQPLPPIQLHAENPDVSFSLNDYFSDPDGDSLSYTVVQSIHEEQLRLAIANSDQFTASYLEQMYGSVGYTIIATDSEGNATSVESTATVNQPPRLEISSSTETETGWIFSATVLDENPGGVTVSSEKADFMQIGSSIVIEIHGGSSNELVTVIATDIHGLSTTEILTIP